MMSGTATDRALVALVAGRVATREAAERAADLVTRLSLEGLAEGLICLAGAHLLGAEGCRAVESPWLDRRGLRHVAARQLVSDPLITPPFLVHSLEVAAWNAAAALADRWGVGFVQEIDDYDAWPPGLGRTLPARCHALVVGSDALARRIAELHGIDPARVLVRIEGVESPERPQDPRARERSNVRVVGVAGRWGVRDGLETFLGAARLILARGLDVEFVLAGEGPLGDELRRRADRLGIADRVTFAEPPTLDDAFWRVLDVYCQPASAPTLGRWAATAMAAGIPVVATRVDGLDRLIQDGRTARPVAPDAPAELSEAILFLLDRPLEARALGERGRRLVDDLLDPDRAVESLRSIYERFLKPA